jgi:hypothetical protein
MFALKFIGLILGAGALVAMYSGGFGRSCFSLSSPAFRK